jgi:uncharacterized protein (UPF0216 family)
MDSIKLRVTEEEDKLKSLDGTEAKNKRREIEDSKEILKEMEDRASRLRRILYTHTRR